MYIYFGNLRVLMKHHLSKSIESIGFCQVLCLSSLELILMNQLFQLILSPPTPPICLLLVSKI